MQLILCIDLSNNIARKAGIDTPVIGRDAVEEAAVSLATVDPEDNLVNVCFQGIKLYNDLLDEIEDTVEVAVVSGLNTFRTRQSLNTGKSDATQAVVEEIDQILASIVGEENPRAIVITDGAWEEIIYPVIESRMALDAGRRVIIPQPRSRETFYYTFKRLVGDPETRTLVLTPLAILSLVPVLSLATQLLGYPSLVLWFVLSVVGLYSFIKKIQ
jgi:putative membrane protein